jgi:hypothetical protein
MKWTSSQLPLPDAAVPSPQPGIPVSRTPFSMIANSSPSESDWVASSVMSGAFGKRFSPIGVFPFPSFPWQTAQWSAKCARAFGSTMGLIGIGLRAFFRSAGTAMLLIIRAMRFSIMVASLWVLNPVRVMPTIHHRASTAVRTTRAAATITPFLMMRPRLPCRTSDTFLGSSYGSRDARCR